MLDREEVVNGLKSIHAVALDDTQLYVNVMTIKRFRELLDSAVDLLEDDAEIIKNYISVLQDITGNRMSKPNYTVPAVLDCVRHHYCDGCDESEEPRMMTVCEVTACKEGTVLWVEEKQGVTWNLFPLEIEVSSTHPDTGMDYLFFITYHDVRKFECSEYNQTWRCWTSRPTDEQREATPWQ